jgi:L-asparagine transporter-like permease
MASSGSFDMSRMSTASKILLGGSVLLLIDSFLPWQKVCVSIAGFGACASANMWGGNGGFFGVVAGLLVILLLVWEIIAVANVDLNMGMSRSKVSAYLGFGVLAFVVIKFIVALTNSPGFGAWIGIVLALAIGYGAWMRFQEPEEMNTPPPAPDTGGYTG